MDILNMSKKDREVIVTLSADELVKLSNVLYHAPDEDRNKLYYQLNSEIILARDMCQYGHIDSFSLAKIVENREKIAKTN